MGSRAAVGRLPSNAEFAEVVARYFGLSSPACTPLVGKQIGSSGPCLDAYGSRLSSAALPGDGYRTQHDAIKWRIYEDAQEMGLRMRPEVYGLFAAALPQPAQLEIGKWPRRKRQGLVPDFLAAIPDADGSPSDAVDELLELKTLHHGGSTYPLNTTERCASVNR